MMFVARNSERIPARLNSGAIIKSNDFIGKINNFAVLSGGIF
jgi:hypothetical protein